MITSSLIILPSIAQMNPREKMLFIFNGFEVFEVWRSHSSQLKLLTSFCRCRGHVYMKELWLHPSPISMYRLSSFLLKGPGYSPLITLEVQRAEIPWQLCQYKAVQKGMKILSYSCWNIRLFKTIIFSEYNLPFFLSHCYHYLMTRRAMCHYDYKRDRQVTLGEFMKWG